MQENAVAKAGQERLKQAIEAKTEKPEVLVREILRQGDVQVTDTLSWIDDQEQSAMDSGDIGLLEELDDIKRAVNEAYAKLKSGLEQAKRTTETAAEDVDEGWDTVQAEQAERVEMSAEEFNENLAGLFNQSNFDFLSFNRLLSAAESTAGRQQDILDSLASKTNGAYARRLMEDPGFRAEMSELAESLAERLDEDGPELMAERSIGNLIVVHEMFGREAAAIAKKMDLKSYEPSLQRQARETVISVGLASFDQETGELAESSVEVGYSFDHTSPTT